MFNLFGRERKTLMEAAQEAKEQPGTRLVDVRSPEEYRGGHVPGAINLPLGNLQAAPQLLGDKTARLYLYCASGARSGMAAGMLRRMGYEHCANVGGIGSYRGPLAY